MRRVAHVLGPSRGGIRRHVRYLAGHPPAGWETSAVWGPADLAPYFEGLPFRPLRRRDLARAGWDADVVHAHGLSVGAAALRPRRPPVVLTMHMDLPVQGRTAANPLLRAAAPVVVRSADAVIAVSGRIRSLFPRARYIPPAVDPLPAPARSRDDVRADLGAAGGDVVALALARLHPDKALDVLVEAVAASGAVGWIAGEGPDHSRLERLARGAAVRFLGYRDDVADLLGAADVLAMTSVGEGYPIAVVEAITAGTPVIATRVGAIEEIVADAGLLVPAGDRAGFAEALTRFTRDADLRAGLTARAREVRLPTPEELVARVGCVYEEVVR